MTDNKVDIEITEEELAQLGVDVVDKVVVRPEVAEEIPTPFGIQSEDKVTVRPAAFAPLPPVRDTPPGPRNIDLLLDIVLSIKVELGQTKMPIRDVLGLGPGSVVELNKLAGEPVDVLVNERLIAHGEVVVIDDKFGVRVTEIIPPTQRVNSLRA